MVPPSMNRSIAVLGVDFMSENVRAILDEAGHREVSVYRMSPGAIGCSLAEAAESEQYNRYALTIPVYISCIINLIAVMDVHLFFWLNILFELDTIPTSF